MTFAGEVPRLPACRIVRVREALTKALRPSRRQGLLCPTGALPGKNLPAGELAPPEECGVQRDDPRRTRNS